MPLVFLLPHLSEPIRPIGVFNQSYPSKAVLFGSPFVILVNVLPECSTLIFPTDFDPSSLILPFPFSFSPRPAIPDQNIPELDADRVGGECFVCVGLVSPS